MIDFYTWTTPNGRKVSIMLEECGLAYTVHPVNITMNQQFEPSFLKISPNNKIPAIVDRESGTTVFESGAILIYLAEKTGRFLARSGDARWKSIEWLMWQMAGFGPMTGQLNHFAVFAKEKIPYAIERYSNEYARLIGVLEKRLAESEYLAGEEYSIADIATYPWVAATLPTVLKKFTGLIKNHAHIDTWLRHVGERPAVQRGMNVPPAH